MIRAVVLSLCVGVAAVAHAQGPPLGSAPGAAASAEGVRQVAENHYAVGAARLDALLADPAALSRTARVIPNFMNGRANGFKLFGIRRTSFYSTVGLKNGDTVHSINGLPLTSPEHAMAIYEHVRRVNRLTFELTRRGQPMTLTIDVEGGGRVDPATALPDLPALPPAAAATALEVGGPLLAQIGPAEGGHAANVVLPGVVLRGVELPAREGEPLSLGDLRLGDVEIRFLHVPALDPSTAIATSLTAKGGDVDVEASPESGLRLRDSRSALLITARVEVTVDLTRFLARDAALKARADAFDSPYLRDGRFRLSCAGGPLPETCQPEVVPP